MSDRTPRISRRKLLQLSGLAPLAALAASGASAAVLAEEAQRIAKIDKHTMRKLVNLAEAYSSGVDEDQFRLVASVLWRYFQDGAYPIEVENAEVVLIAAFNKKGQMNSKESGKLIVDNLSKWDCLGHNSATNSCAYRCGDNARKIVAGPKSQKTRIDKQVFEKAWDTTETEVHLLLENLRAYRKRMGNDDELTGLGDGC